MLDLSNPETKKWFTDALQQLQVSCGVDGFKLDAGDTEFYKDSYLSHEKLDVNEQAQLFHKIGLAFPLNEYRAS
jgi:alpha-glucosidase